MGLLFGQKYFLYVLIVKNYNP